MACEVVLGHGGQPKNMSLLVTVIWYWNQRLTDVHKSVKIID